MPYEQVEVMTNPRTRHRRTGHDDIVDVHLSKAEIRRALTRPKRKKRAVAVAEPKKKKRKKGRRGRRASNPKNILVQLVIGAAVTAALEIYVFRNPQWQKQIPAQVRRFSGLIFALAGWAVTMMPGRGMMGQMRPVGYGMLAAGVYIQLSDVLIQMRKDNLIAELDKIMAKAKEVVEGEETGTEGLGVLTLPNGRRVSAKEAALMLGMQSRVPFHPHGMGGEYAGGGVGEMVMLGEFVDVPGGIHDPAMDERLRAPGLGEMTDSSHADEWLEGQFAWREADYGDSW